MLREVTAGPLGIIFDAHGMDAKGTIRVLGGGSEASQRQEQRAETLPVAFASGRSEEHTSELQSQSNLVCRLLLEKKKKSDSRATIPGACSSLGQPGKN